MKFLLGGGIFNRTNAKKTTTRGYLLRNANLKTFIFARPALPPVQIVQRFNASINWFQKGIDGINRVGKMWKKLLHFVVVVPNFLQHRFKLNIKDSDCGEGVY